jgi:hypothetical protein
MKVAKIFDNANLYKLFSLALVVLAQQKLSEMRF